MQTFAPSRAAPGKVQRTAKSELGIDGTRLCSCMKYSGSVASDRGPPASVDRGRQLRRGGLICKYAAGLKSPLAVVRLDV